MALRAAILGAALVSPALAGADEAEAEGAAVETAPIESSPSAVAERDLPDGVESVYSSPEAREALHATVYQSGGASLREQRDIGLRDGANRLLIGGLPETLRPESVLIESEHVPEVVLTRFTRGELDEDRLLDLHLGRLVRVQGPRDEAPREGRLLSARGDHVIVDFDRGVESVRRAPETRLLFPGVPAGLRGTPTLEADLESERGGTEPVTLSYRAEGLTWTPSYRLVLGDDASADAPASLSAIANIEQQTGVELPGARLKLVATRLQEHAGAAQLRAEAVGIDQARLEGSPTFEVERPVDLRPGSSHQVRLFSEETLVERTWRTRGRADARPEETQRTPVARRLYFDAPADLPDGETLVYTRGGSAAHAEPIGAGRLAATPAGEPVELEFGTAFDVTARRSLLERRTLENGDGFEAEWVVEVRNRGGQTRTIEVMETVPGEWEIVEETREHQRQGAAHAVWTLDVPAGGTQSLTYRVRVEED